jgi:hypothetical protein
MFILVNMSTHPWNLLLWKARHSFVYINKFLLFFWVLEQNINILKCGRFMRRSGDCRGDIMQEINSLTRLTISPRGVGHFLSFARKCCPILWGICLFWYGIQSQSPLISRGGGGGGRCLLWLVHYLKISIFIK